MLLNTWWLDDPRERFWMEITDREVLGTDLTAPQVNGAGQAEWSYQLVAETRPGDIVLHWHKHLVGEPALVGWSEVTGPLSEGSIRWQAHGTRGRARGGPVTSASWTMQCGGFNPLPSPITGRQIGGLEREVRAVKAGLQAKHRGALYFPFAFYRPGELRAAQAYLTKFPADLLDTVDDLRDVRAAKVGRPPSGATRGVGSGRIRDAALRKALERHAVEAAKRYYVAQGATDVIELGAPFDLIVRGLGRERHVEVKGSSLDAVAVELTVNEVTHAQGHVPMDLYVVDQIAWRKLGDSDYETSGGRARVWADWTPGDSDLSVTRFRYDLPMGAGSGPV